MQNRRSQQYLRTNLISVAVVVYDNLESKLWHGLPQLIFQEFGESEMQIPNMLDNLRQILM